MSRSRQYIQRDVTGASIIGWLCVRIRREVRPVTETEKHRDVDLLDIGATISREEVFGPVLSVIPFDSDDDAVRIANDSAFGLTAVIYGRKRSRTMSVARRIRAGTVCVGSGTFNPAAPIGGYKHSGIGREGGVWGLREFQEVKHLSWI